MSGTVRRCGVLGRWGWLEPVSSRVFECQARREDFSQKALEASGCFRQVRQDEISILGSLLGRMWAGGLKEVPVQWSWGEPAGARGVVRCTSG